MMEGLSSLLAARTKVDALFAQDAICEDCGAEEAVDKEPESFQIVKSDYHQDFVHEVSRAPDREAMGGWAGGMKGVIAELWLFREDVEGERDLEWRRKRMRRVIKGCS